jgi:hypothetical protein
MPTVLCKATHIRCEQLLKRKADSKPDSAQHAPWRSFGLVSIKEARALTVSFMLLAATFFQPRAQAAPVTGAFSLINVTCCRAASLA